MDNIMADYDFVKIGKRIKGYRKEHHITQEALASELNDNGIRANRQTIYRIEKGEPGDNFFDILLILCDIFKTDIGHLLGEHEARTQLIADISKYTGLSCEAVEALNRHRRDPSPYGTAALNALFESKEFDEITERLATYFFGYSYEMIPDSLPEGAISGRDSKLVPNNAEYKNVIQPAQLIALGICLSNIEKSCHQEGKQNHNRNKKGPHGR